MVLASWYLLPSILHYVDSKHCSMLLFADVLTAAVDLSSIMLEGKMNTVKPYCSHSEVKNSFPGTIIVSFQDSASFLFFCIWLVTIRVRQSLPLDRPLHFFPLK